jgi:type VI secretion system secreted protein VgrG
MADLQKNKICRLKTPLAEDLLLVGRLKGREGISELFHFELDLVSPDTAVGFQDVIGKKVTVEIELKEGRMRHINGFVSRFCQIDSPDIPLDTAEITASYWMEIVPWFWFLTRRKDCRIFQNMTVPDIVKEVFEKLGFSEYDIRLSGTYDPLVNCVQYQETDFAFVSRLLESAGIYYFFEHEESRHVLVLGDSPEQCLAVPGMESALYTTGAQTGEKEDRVHSWRVEEVLQPGRYSMTDYNFFDPNTDLAVESFSALKQSGTDDYEFFDYPGKFVNHGGEEEGKLAKGESLVKLRMEEGDARAIVANGASKCRFFLPGFYFSLDGHPRSEFNQAWLLVGVTHDLDQSGALRGDSDEKARYGNLITCIPNDVPFRPARITQRPRIPGAQTAMVVGPEGEEIYVDKYGRVKVQFCWDRYGKADENSSCWVRVSQNMAGKKWGVLFHPRLGQEVVVEFLDGDPDRPLITGRVYNASQPIPFDGPTQSGILTRSTKEGTAENFNQIRFDDKKDSEEIYVHAEKDMLRVVENGDKEQVGGSQSSTVGSEKSISVGKSHQEEIAEDMTLSVGKNRSLTVGESSTETIAKNRDLSVGENNSETTGKNLSVSVGENQTVSVGKNEDLNVGANQTINVGKNRTMSVGKNLTVDVGGASAYETKDGWVLKAKKIGIEAKDELKIKVGSAEFVMKKNGDINIKGKKINVKGSGDVVIKGKKIAQN